MTTRTILPRDVSLGLSLGRILNGNPRASVEARALAYLRRQVARGMNPWLRLSSRKETRAAVQVLVRDPALLARLEREEQAETEVCAMLDDLARSGGFADAFEMAHALVANARQRRAGGALPHPNADESEPE